MVPIEVGTHQLFLPVVVVTWAGWSYVGDPCPEEGSGWLCSVPLETLVAHSGKKGKPVSATSREVLLVGYNAFKNTKLDTWFDIPQLCGMLKRQWASQQCSGPSLFKDNLRRLTLIEVNSLTKTNSPSWIGGQKEGVRQVVQKMRFANDEPITDCASDGQGLCTAAMPLSKGVLVVWIISSFDAHSIRRQAAAIRSFLINSAGREKNCEELKATLSSAT
jgi:hypothetical protein